MRYRNSLLVLSVAAVGIFLGRAELAPYLPGFLAKTASVKSDAKDLAGGSGQKQGAAGHGGHAVTVTVATAKAGSLPITRKAIGTIVPIASTALSSLASGIVAEVLVKDGADVKAGDLLVQLDDRTIKANIQRDTATLTKDQATLDDANTTLKRVQALSNAGAQTQQQLDDAVAAAKQAEGAIAVDQANLAADKVALTQTQIRAPFDGKLGVILFSPGAYVAPGADIVTLTQMKPVYAEFTLAEPDLDLARSALSAGKLNVRIAPMMSQDDTTAASGPIVFIDNAVDPASGTFKLRALLENADSAFWPGQSLDITVNAGEKDGLVIVPAVSLQPHDDGSICYVVGQDNTVQVRKVEVALSAGDTAGIARGLEKGEVVVTEGQAGLVEGTHVTVVSAPEPTAEKVADSASDAGAAQ
ncbi:efflux RND transporter periplasmic adaptor subunit [Pararhizobium polonicum]|uniref:efflux RND transporter periplasmic adaptor subunit n=1 Tax=Pararhizobium polonicum TaxID=1612624 RepID=UPI0009F742CF|nr:efflux RND transporter periplasmic adaptor subunit [Pararhizobium polonicum]